jgi:hypothetical protein
MPTEKAQRMRRETGGRKNAVKVLLSDTEQQEIRSRAEAAGLSVPRLLVEAALSLSSHRLVGAISNNLNQLTKVAHATGRMPEGLPGTPEATTRVLARLEQDAKDLRGGR